LPLEISFCVDGMSKMERVVLSHKQQHFEIAADKKPATVTLDPNTWVLMEARFAKFD
jgi:hypothetical protein